MILHNKVSEIIKFVEMIQEEWWSGAGEGRMTFYCLMVMKFQLGKFRSWMVMMVAQ